MIEVKKTPLFSCGRILLIFLAFLASVAYYKLFVIDPDLSWKSKLAHYALTVLSHINGSAFGKFNRKFSPHSPTTYENEGIKSTLIQIPHYQDQNVNIPAKFYQSVSQNSSTLFLYYHGGGFVHADSPLHDLFLREIAKKDVKILSVEYRLAPEYRFPIPVHDSYSALVWIKSELKKESTLGKIDRLVIGGDSAGGNLASIVAIMNKDLGLNVEISKQILIYPYLLSDLHHPVENRHYYFLSAPMLNMFVDSYLGDKIDEYKDSDLLKPMNYKKSLSFLPKTMIITAEYDPLRVDGEVYHERLLSDGVESNLYKFKSIHGFTLIPFDDYYQEALDLVINEIQ